LRTGLKLGADIAVHSTTKYLCGYSDLTGGAVIEAKDLIDPIWRKNLGQMKAQAVAEFLLGHLKVKQVNMTEAVRRVSG